MTDETTTPIPVRADQPKKSNRRYIIASLVILATLTVGVTTIARVGSKEVDCADIVTAQSEMTRMFCRV